MFFSIPRRGAFRVKAAHKGASGANRHKASDDDILLQSAKIIGFALDGGVRKYLGRLLEGRGAEETFGGQTRLGDAQQHRFRLGVGFLFFIHPLADFLEAEMLDKVALKKRGVAGFDDFHEFKHLAYNDFDMLVVGIDPLGFVNRLHFLDEEELCLANSLRIRIGPEDISWIDKRFLCKRLPLLYFIPFLDGQMFADELFLLEDWRGFMIIRLGSANSTVPLIGVIMAPVR